MWNMLSMIIIISIIIVVVPVINFFIKLKRNKMRDDSFQDRMSRMRDRYNGLEDMDDDDEDDDEIRKIDKI